MKVGGLFTALQNTLSGLSNQMKRLEVVSENIANAEKSPDKNGKVYRRKIFVSENKRKHGPKSFNDHIKLKMSRSSSAHFSSASNTGSIKNDSENQFPFKVVKQKGEKLVFNPSHPNADENGYVKMPDINAVEEMVDLIAAHRTYEANVTVMNAAKGMAKKSLEI